MINTVVICLHSLTWPLMDCFMKLDIWCGVTLVYIL